VDRTGKMDLSQLRALQDWFLKYELKAVPTFRSGERGRHGQQYQIVLIPTGCVRTTSAWHGNGCGPEGEPGDRRLVLELGEAEYMVRAPAICRPGRFSQDP